MIPQKTANHYVTILSCCDSLGICIFLPLQLNKGDFDAALAQHFLLSKEARDLGIKQITRLTEEQAFALYVTVRFAHNGGKPQCVRCGAQNPYFIKTRRK